MNNEKRQISIFSVIGAGYGIFVAIIVGISFLSINRISFIDRNLSEINNVNSAKQRVAIDYRGSVHDRSISIRDVVLAENNSDLNSYIAEIRQKESDYVDAKTRMQNNFIAKSMLTTQEQSILDKINNTENAAMPLIQGIISDKEKGDNAEMVAKLDRVRPLFVDWLKYINEFINLEESKNQSVTPIVTKSTANFKWMMILNSVVALILGFSIAFFIIKYLVKLLGGDPQDASKSFNAISQGDLTNEVKLNQKHPDSMLSHMVFMQGHLRNVINSIQHSAEELGRSTHVVADSSVQAQAAAEEQHNASMQSVDQIKIISAGTAKIAEIAKQTEQNSEKTLDLSKKGNDAMNNTTKAINGVSNTVLETAEKIKTLKDKSDEIGGSVSLIAEVADQTNLLALNAAIEAARAGEHGRGFAVVADEVRKLAERTGDTTTQITNMITAIQKDIEVAVSAMEQTLPQVEKGLELAGITSDILNEIQQQANDSLTLAQDVTSSSVEQENGINNIEKYLAEMADMSLNTQNMMQENVKEVEKLETISVQLKEEASFFKL